MHTRFTILVLTIFLIHPFLTPAAGRAQEWRSMLDLPAAPPNTVPVGQCAGPPEPLRPPADVPWEWILPKPQGDNLLGVWGTANDDIWAVGDKGRVLRFDGRRWNVLQPGVNEYLAGVWASGPGDVWFTGYNGRVLRFDGKRWWLHPTGVSNDFNGIWGSGPKDVFTVGDRGVIFHFDGTCWTRQETGTEDLFFGVWGSGPKNVWAVGGRGNVAHYDGTAWTPIQVDAGKDAHFVAVWGTGPDNVYIVGNGGTVLHKRGQHWGREEVGTQGLLRWVWGTGPSDVWVAGDEGVVRHFDGNRWKAASIGANRAVRGAWSAANGSRTVLVGDDGLLVSGTLSSLKSEREGVYNELYAVTGPWAVGENGTVLRRDRKGRWNPVPMQTTERFNTVATLADGRVLIGGKTSTWVWDGRHWRQVGTKGEIHAIRAWGTRAVAVGDGGLVLRWNNSAWTQVRSPTKADLYGVGGSSAESFWVVGDGGIAFRYQGGRWTSHPVPDQEPLTGVSDSGVAVGRFGGVYRWERNRWAQVGHSGGMSLYGVADDPSGGAWAVGDFGTVLRVERTGVTAVQGVTGQTLRAAAPGGGRRMTLVGDGGSMLDIRGR